MDLNKLGSISNGDLAQTEANITQLTLSVADDVSTWNAVDLLWLVPRQLHMM